MHPWTLRGAAFFLSFLTPSLVAADRAAPSAQPPAGLAAAQVPQLVMMGFDDNPDVEPMTWLVDFLEGKRNPAGAGAAGTFDGGAVRAIFYSNGKHWNDAALVAIHRRAHATGHEIGNHTQNHHHGRGFDAATWAKEIADCDRTFVDAGIPADALGGFRTPFLEYNAATFAALAASPRLYDTSIEEGNQPGQDGTNFLWPYTLDEGSPGNAAQFADRPAYLVGRHAGFWEIPLHVFLVPPDELCAQYGAKPGLRTRMQAHIKAKWGWNWNPAAGKITGLDWNVFEAAGCDGPEFLAILKYTLDLRLAGNRAPFMVGGHTALYPADKPDRRKALEEFVAYALSKPEVRFVTGRQLLEWLRRPTAVSRP